MNHPSKESFKAALFEDSFLAYSFVAVVAFQNWEVRGKYGDGKACGESRSRAAFSGLLK
jgi:hypothetical protein